MGLHQTESSSKCMQRNQESLCTKLWTPTTNQTIHRQVLLCWRRWKNIVKFVFQDEGQFGSTSMACIIYIMAHVIINTIIVQVLSLTVASAFSHYSLEETEETEKFVWYFDKFFDCLNVRSLSECVHSRKPDLRPYRNPDDPRLQVIHNIHNFILYLSSHNILSSSSGSRMTFWVTLTHGNQASKAGKCTLLYRRIWCFCHVRLEKV